jgi:hypothetical protein
MTFPASTRSDGHVSLSETINNMYSCAHEVLGSVDVSFSEIISVCELCLSFMLELSIETSSGRGT